MFKKEICKWKFKIATLAHFVMRATDTENRLLYDESRPQADTEKTESSRMSVSRLPLIK